VDLDGTLLGADASFLRDGDGNFSLLGARALEACSRAGVEVVIYSGRRQLTIASDLQSFIHVTGQVGVGAGIVIDGQLFPGTKGFSGEIGHCPIVEDGPLCSCGLRGCLETLASGRAIERIAAEAVQSGVSTKLSEHKSPLEASLVFEAARMGDAVAQRILHGVGQQLGVGLSYLINVLDPELVVLGGRVMEAADFILEGARASVARHTLRSSKVEVVASTLGDRAGLVGSVIAAMDLSVRSYRVVATAERMA